MATKKITKKKKGFAVVNRCKSKAKTTGKRCKKNACVGRDDCELHGGKTPRGWANPNTKHGGYSKHMPTRLGAEFEASLNDPQLHDLKSEMALVNMRIKELLGKLDLERDGSAWEEVKGARDNIRIAMKSQSPTQMIFAFNYLDDVINRAYGDTEIWDNITRLIEQQRKLAESYRKIIADAETTITAENIIGIAGAIVRIISDHVSDPKRLSAINQDIGLLFAARDNRTIRH